MTLVIMTTFHIFLVTANSKWVGRGLGDADHPASLESQKERVAAASGWSKLARMGNQLHAKCINNCNPNVCCAYCIHKNLRNQEVDDKGTSIGPSHRMGTDDIAFDHQHLEKELANEVELLRMETSFKIPLDVLASQSFPTRTSTCAPTSASSARSSNMVPNESASATITTTTAAGAAFGNQDGIGGATNRNHLLDAGEVLLEESPANLDVMLSEDLRHTPSFLSTVTAEMKVKSHDAISKEVIEVAAAAAAAAAAKTADGVRIEANGNDANTSSTTPPPFEEIITFEDLYDESAESMSQHSFAGFVEEGAPRGSPKGFVCHDDWDHVAQTMSMPRCSQRPGFTDGEFPEFPDSPGGSWFRVA